MRWASHATALGLVAILSLLSRALLKERYARELRQIGASAREQRSREIEAAWQRLDYHNAAEHGVPEMFLTKVNWSALTLSELQKAVLRIRLAELLKYFQCPSFEEYYRLKTEGVRYEFEPDPGVRELLPRTATNDDGGRKAGPKEMVRIIWSAVHAHGGKETVPKLTAFCLDHIAAAMGLSRLIADRWVGMTTIF